MKEKFYSVSFPLYIQRNLVQVFFSLPTSLFSIRTFLAKVLLTFTKKINYHFYHKCAIQHWLANFWRWATLNGLIAFNNYQVMCEMWNVKNVFKTECKAGLTLNDLYDTTCMIQLVWLCKIANSYKLNVQIFVWYNF